MGSRFSSLTAPENVRLWSNQGLQFIHNPGWQDTLAQSAPVSPAAGRRPQAPARPNGPAPSASSAQSAQQARAAHSASGHSESAVSKAPKTASRPQQSATSPKVTIPKGADPLFVQPHEGELPERWQAFMERCSDAPRIVFTYWELANDLGELPDPDRRKVWQRLLGKLAWPTGTSGFMPLSEPAPKHGLSARPALFWRCLNDLNPSHVAVFGRRAFMTLFPDREPRLTVFKYQSRVFMTFPDPIEFVKGNVPSMKYTLEKLQGLGF